MGADTKNPLLLVVLLGACAGTNVVEARVRASLEILNTVMEPAYQITTDTCLARQEELVTAAERGVPDARTRFHQVTARCHALIDTFAIIREMQLRAREALDSNQLAEAERELDKVRASWSSLQSTDAGVP